MRTEYKGQRCPAAGAQRAGTPVPGPDHLRKTDQYESTWALLDEQWRGRAFLGTTKNNVPVYSQETGCMSIALDSDASRDLIPRLLGRCILAQVKEIMEISACAQRLRQAIQLGHLVAEP